MIKNSKQSSFCLQKPKKSSKTFVHHEKKFKIFSTELPEDETEDDESYNQKILNKNKGSKSNKKEMLLSTKEKSDFKVGNIFDLSLKDFDEDQMYYFGKLYEDNLLYLVHKHLEIGCNHLLLYVGDKRSNFSERLEKYFCLLNPVTLLNIEEKSGNQLKNLSVEQDLIKLNRGIIRKRFDRILFHDSIRNINDLKSTFEIIMKNLPSFGKVLIIHRPGKYNTFPNSQKCKEQNTKFDIPFINIIKALESTGADVQWDLVHIPFKIPKHRWFSMIQNKFPNQPNRLNEEEIFCGIKELCQGAFRYFEEDEMEAEDRLMMITASHRSFDCGFPSIQRVRGSSQLPYSEVADQNLYLPIDEEVSKILSE